MYATFLPVSVCSTIDAHKHNPQDHVQFVVNAEYSEMLEWLSRASIGLSTMIDEHFGINIVEYMVGSHRTCPSSVADSIGCRQRESSP